MSSRQKTQSATFSQFRNNAKKYFDAVEKGASVEIYRHGKLLARVIPALPESRARWATSAPIHIDGMSLSEAILSERRS